jgi:hypothetical protein
LQGNDVVALAVRDWLENCFWVVAVPHAPAVPEYVGGRYG